MYIQVPYKFGQAVNMDACPSITGVVTGYRAFSEGVDVQVCWWMDGRHESAWFSIWRLSPCGEVTEN